MADPSSRTNDSLHLAVERGDEEAVKGLLEQCHDLEALDKDRYTALYLSCVRKLGEIAELLLDHGASVHTTNGADGSLALHSAAYNGMEDTVALLLKRGADARAVDRNGFTALHRAADKGYESMIMLLLKNSADIEAETNNGDTPLSIAVSSGRSARAADRLIRSGANVHWTTTQGSNLSLLHLAAEAMNIPAMQLLLDSKLDIDIVDGAGMTSLQYVLGGYNRLESLTYRFCRYSRLATLKWLLNNGAGINYQCRRNGFTALHFAVQSGRTPFVELLLKYGVDLNVEDKEGRTPVSFAAGLSHTALYPAFAKQLVMMKALNLFVSERNLKTLSKDDDLKRCSVPCDKEMDRMRKIKISDTNIKVFDLFSNGENRLARFAANEILERVLEDDSCMSEFPIYANVICRKILQGRKRIDLLKRSTECLFSVINEFYQLPQECVEMISLWLTNADLKLLIE